MSAELPAGRIDIAPLPGPSSHVVIGGAPHGFRADYRASYRKEAADDGWAQMQA